MVSEYDFHREDWSMSSNAEGIEEADPAPAKAGLWEDFVDIFYAPSSVFARRADGKFGMALLFLVVVGTILYFLTRNAIQPMMDAEFAIAYDAQGRPFSYSTSDQKSLELNLAIAFSTAPWPALYAAIARSQLPKRS